MLICWCERSLLWHVAFHPPKNFARRQNHIAGRFQCQGRQNHDIWHGVIGHHSVGNMNSIGHRLFSLCSELGLSITNTFFQLRDMHKTSLMHPRSKHWQIIYYVFVRRRDMNEDTLLELCVGQSAPLITA